MPKTKATILPTFLCPLSLFAQPIASHFIILDPLIALIVLAFQYGISAHPKELAKAIGGAAITSCLEWGVTRMRHSTAPLRIPTNTYLGGPRYKAIAGITERRPRSAKYRGRAVPKLNFYPQRQTPQFIYTFSAIICEHRSTQILSWQWNTLPINPAASFRRERSSLWVRSNSSLLRRTILLFWGLSCFLFTTSTYPRSYSNQLLTPLYSIYYIY